MNCEQCQELLHARECAGLSSELQAGLATHLRDCGECAQASAALLELQALLDTEVPPSPVLRSQVLARLAREATPRHAPLAAGVLFARLWPSRPLGAFSYSLALVMCGMFGGQLLQGAGLEPGDAAYPYQLCPVPERPGAAVL